jgi:metal-sulfur cluster biosynthetic enzyme
MDQKLIKTEIFELLKMVNDPELGVNISDLGLIDKIVVENKQILIFLGTTSPVCPASSMMRSTSKEIVQDKFPDFTVEIKPAENFTWSNNRLSDVGKMLLNLKSGTLNAEIPQVEKPALSGPIKSKLAIQRVPFLLGAVICLLMGLWVGLIRMGWVWPVNNPEWLYLHGPLMVCGFLGTVIGLERAVGLEKYWGFFAPFLAALGGIMFLILGAASIFPMMLITISSFFYSAIFLTVLIKHRDFPTSIMTLGALCWLIGNILFLNGFMIYQLVPWWICFLVFTIAGERIELNRFLSPKSESDYFFIGIIVLASAAALISMFSPQTGIKIFGLSLILLMIWLFLFDIARRTVLREGLTKYIAICLLTGYFWLGISGLIALLIGFKAAGPYYDAFLHTTFIGFVFSMIFGHAPIIFPGILKINIQFHRRFYVHLFLLHFGLIIRVLADLSLNWDFRLWGALINALAIILFFLNTVTSIKK